MSEEASIDKISNWICRILRRRLLFNQLVLQFGFHLLGTLFPFFNICFAIKKNRFVKKSIIVVD